MYLPFSPLPSVQFSCSVVSYSLQHHEPQHARPPCPSPTPRVHPNLSIASVMPSNHLILCHPLLLLPSVFPSIMVFPNESTLCIFMWSFLHICVLISCSYKDINHIGLKSNLVTPFYLNYLFKGDFFGITDSMDIMRSE